MANKRHTVDVVSNFGLKGNPEPEDFNEIPLTFVYEDGGVEVFLNGFYLFAADWEENLLKKFKEMARKFR